MSSQRVGSGSQVMAKTCSVLLYSDKNRMNNFAGFVDVEEKTID